MNEVKRSLPKTKDHIFYQDLITVASQFDPDRLLALTTDQVRPLLPSIVRAAVCPGLDTSPEWEKNKTKLLLLCNRDPQSNDILKFLETDFSVLREDLLITMTSQKKAIASGSSPESLMNISCEVISIYEASPSLDRFRRLGHEMALLLNLSASFDSKQMALFTSDLFSSSVYLPTTTDLLCLLCAELPAIYDVISVCHALLYANNGNKAICKLLANNPDQLPAVFDHFFHLLDTDNSKDESPRGPNLEQRVQSCLLALCDVSSGQALTIRSLCVQHCQMADLAVILTLDYLPQQPGNDSKMLPVHHAVTFVSGLLLGNDSKAKSWFAAYLRATRSDLDNCLWCCLVTELKLVVKSAMLDSKQELHCLLDCQCVRAAGILRLFCAIRAIPGIRFHDNESQLLLLLITSFPPFTPAGVRFVSLALATLLLCPTLIKGSSEERRVVSWIRWLSGKSLETDHLASASTFAEQLLLTAIHLLEDRKQEAVRLAQSILGVRIKVEPSTFTKIRTIFTKEVFPTQKVAEHAIKVPPTPQINANLTGYLPVHCVFQLLQTRAFCSYQIPVRDWIYDQILVAASPLHPQLQPLIFQFVSTLVNPPSHRGLHTHTPLNTPFTQQQILRVYSVDYVTSLTSKLLMLYYVLLYEENVLNHTKELVTVPNRPMRLPAALINAIPVKLLLHKARLEPRACSGLYPALFGLLINHLPHLCMTSDSLDENSPPRPLSNDCMTSLNANSFYQSLQRASVSSARTIINLRALSHQHTRVDDVIGLVRAFTWGLPHLLDVKVARRVRQEALKFWLRLNSLVPRQLWVSTISSLLPSSSSWTSSKLPEDFKDSLDFQKLVDDPLTCLSVDVKALRCPEFFQMILRILEASLSAAKANTVAMLKANPTLVAKGQRHKGQRSLAEVDKEKEDLRSALIATLQGTAVQILIEICGFDDVTSDDDDVNLLTSRREIQCLACSAIHQIFIQDKRTARLVHLQGYSPKLIAVLVAGIPSMHICVDFVSELLQLADHSKHLFAFELASHLCLHYRMPKQLAVGRLCLATMSTLITVIPNDEFCGFFDIALDSIPNFTSAFPPLVRQSILILLHLAKFVQASVASQQSHLLSTDVEDWKRSQDEDSYFSDNSFVCLYSKIRKIYRKILLQNKPESAL